MDVRLYASLNDINLLVFEISRLTSILFEGPACECDKGCELGISSNCEEVFLTMEKEHVDEVIHIAKTECTLEGFRIEEVLHEETETHKQREKRPF